MIKKLTLALAALLCCAVLSAQRPTGGVKGTVVNRNGRQPVEKATLTLYKGAVEVATVESDENGNFLIPAVADGMYDLVITAPDFLASTVNVTVNDGYVKNMFNLSLTTLQQVAEIDDDSFAAFDMDDSGYSDNPTILFGANDVFNNIAGYNFSAVRFRVRGYLSETQEVTLAGVPMNDAITGYSPFSLWSGLNEAMRAKQVTSGLESSDDSFGGFNGVTDIFGNANNVRKGLRGSILTNSALYRFRVMASYASGLLDNGWSFAANVSARLGGNDWVNGVFYRSFAYYLAADKRFNDAHQLGFIFFATPGERGAQNGSTQEVYDLVGDNMYNSNWGYQCDRVRNARVRRTNEPVAVLKYDFTPSDRFKASLTALYRFGKNGYTALDWYDAQSPMPDYYRNLPSYFWMDNKDYNRRNFEKAAWMNEIWTHANDYRNLTHINWDRLYQVNYLQGVNGAPARSKYVQEERHVDQRDLNFAGSAKWRASDWFTLTFGFNARINRTENYKILADLLGGDYFLNIDSFAERDYASSMARVQNDLDYYLQHGSAQVLHEGDKYGYDYYAQVRNARLWANGRFVIGNLTANLGGRIGYETFWREGLMRKGLFPGLRPDGSDYVVEGINLSRDASGALLPSSYGSSEHARFLTYAGKAGLSYAFGGKMRVYANAGYFNDAPHFNQAFLSPRTRNSLVDGLTTVKTFSSDLNWQYTGGGFNARVTAFYTKINDQSKVMTAYDDIQNAFSNFAISGINERHMGVEVGLKAPTGLPNLAVVGVVSAGRYVYTSTPRMVQTIDNSATPVSFGGQTSVLVPYWPASPVFKRDSAGENTGDVERWQKHFVPSTPQLAASLGLNYSYNYWFIDAGLNYFAEAYLDMNPLYRTDFATAGPDGYASPVEIEYMTTQEKFDPCLMLDVSVGKSWYIQRKYQLGFSLNAKNLLNNTHVKTGGYEQTRLVDNTVGKERYYKFDPKYFYMSGFNYMLNIYFRF